MVECDDCIQIEVAWPRLGGVLRCLLHLPAGSTAADALARAVRSQGWPVDALQGWPLGVFSRRIEPGHVLHDGDRLEIYRPLQLDPKEARRRRATYPRRSADG